MTNKKQKFNLGAHPNVYNTAVILLEEQGLNVMVNGELDDDGCIILDSVNWRAENDDLLIYSTNPIDLLGLFYIHKNLQPKEVTSNWWVQKDNRIDELYDEAFPD